ncbi:alpha/beta fold hydrolase [Acidisphaera sp. L21]|uniref:alpha/beta fold hydrolase n=1 Tax=Acidisphaera sp. L21 TaxID=1641851 RepID=UPI00131DCDB0|nr:alpha/beta fold hydrolase [Acidisphaera sp. L21]
MSRILAIVVALTLSGPTAFAQTKWPGQAETDTVLHDFAFASGEHLAAMTLHATTIGMPQRDAAGEITNAILLLHGTSGTGKNWLTPSFADEMFAPGKPMDAAKFYVILPDGIGRGGSAKPSDGLKMAFPHYRYGDMVRATYQQVTQGLGVHHLRLVLGASMGGMQTWMFAGMYPDFMDAAVPMASQPVRISGRNWISRRVAIEAIRNDPGWQDGNYTTPPMQWTFTAPAGRLLTDNVQALAQVAPSVDAGDALYRRMVDNARHADARDSVYATEAVMDYAPEDLLPRITTHLLAINSADDDVNPAVLNTVGPAVAKIPGAHYVLLPADLTTRGHYTYEQAAKWSRYLVELMAGQTPG